MIIRLHLLEMWLELSMYISRRLFWLLYIRIYLWIYMLSHSLNSLPSLWCWIFLFYFFVKRFSNIFILAVFEPFFFSRVKLVIFYISKAHWHRFLIVSSLLFQFKVQKLFFKEFFFVWNTKNYEKFDKSLCI